MAALRWTQPATEDLRGIQQYIARDSREYARRMGQRIRQAANRLRSFPESGRIVPEFPDDQFREVIVGAYRVIYRYLPEQNLVAILAVNHGSRPLVRPPNGV